MINNSKIEIVIYQLKIMNYKRTQRITKNSLRIANKNKNNNNKKV